MKRRTDQYMIETATQAAIAKIYKHQCKQQSDSAKWHAKDQGSLGDKTFETGDCAVIKSKGRESKTPKAVIIMKVVKVDLPDSAHQG